MNKNLSTEMSKAAGTDLLHSRVGIAGHVRCTGDGEGFVLLDLQKGLYHSLDGVSADLHERYTDEPPRRE